MTDKSTKEQIEALKQFEKQRAAFSNLKDIIRLIDLTTTANKTYTTYSRESLRTYLRNPASDTNQKNLRKLSEFLYTMSHVYRRIINNKANQLSCENWIAWPHTGEDGMVSDESFEHYTQVCKYVEDMRFHTQIKKCMVKAWLDDVVYGFCYGDPNDGEFYIHILDPDYCRISSQNFYGGKLNFAFDFSFFSGTNAFYLDSFDPVFKKMYTAYDNGTADRWQELPSERTFCVKINDENLDFPVPPFAGMFDSLISLIDLQQVQDLKDELSAYKLIWAKINTISGTKQVDDFEIDLELASQFYDKIQTALPDNVAIALSPMDLDSIDFQSEAEDANIINNAYKNIVEANGDIISNSNKITNSTSFKLALFADAMQAMAPVTQINTWVNFYIQQNLKIDDVEIEFSNVSRYFVEDRINLLLKVAQYGVPVKSELASLVGLNPARCRSMEYVEDKLGLSKETWIHPLVSSNVQGAINDGTKELEPGELTDEGEKTRDKK